MKKRVTSQTRKQLDGRGNSVSSNGAPADLLERLTTIPLLFNSRTPLKSISVVVAEDSWATGERVGLRDIVDGHLRHIAFAGGTFRFELVAERRSRQWEFVGRVYRHGRIVNDMVLILGRRRLLPGVGGFFHWSSTHVTRRLSFMSSKQRLTLESIVW